MTRVNVKSREVCEVKTVLSEDEANKLLKEGWILLHGGISHVDDFGYNTKPHYMMGKPNEQ